MPLEVHRNGVQIQPFSRKRIGVTCLTFQQGQVTSSVTWPFWYTVHYVISYWWSFGTESLNPAVFKILRSNYWGHEIDLFKVTWRHRSRDHLIAHMPFPIGGPFIETKPLSLAVSEIFNVKCHAMADRTLIQHLNEGQGHSLWYQSISHTTSYRLSTITFALGRTV